MQRHHLISFWLLAALVAALPACDGAGSTVPDKPTPTPATYSSKLYVSESGLNRIESLDMTTGKVLATIPVGTQPTMMVYDHHTQNGWDNFNDPAAALWVLNVSSASVTRIDPRTDKAVITIAVGGSPVDIAAAQNSSHLLYVADGQSNSVAIINEDDNSIVGHIATSGRPFQLSANDGVLMIAETNNTVELVDDTKPSTVPSTKIATQSTLMGVGTNFDAYPAIETADGIVHFYKPQTYGGLPWANVANYTLPHGAGQLYCVGYGNFAVINAASKLVQWIDFDSNDNTTVEHDLATGAAPGFGTSGSVGDFGYFYIPNAGGDSLSVYWKQWQPFGSWPLSSGARPITALSLQYQNNAAASPTPSPTAAPTSTPTPASTPTPSPTPSSSPPATQHLYVADGSGGNVLEYASPFSASSTPSVNLNVGGSIWGVASDSKYVAVEDSNGYVYIFAQPLSASASPVASFQAGNAGAQLYFDSNGNLYTGDEGAEVLEYSPPFSNTNTPAKVINGTTASFSLTMDYNNNLYAGDLGMNQIDLFAPPYSAAPTTVAQPGTYGLASYATYLYGADAASSKIEVYSLPISASSTPAFAITNTDPHALAADVSTGTLYVGDQHGGNGSGSIDVYNQPLSGSSTAAYSITSGVKEPVQVWIGP